MDLAGRKRHAWPTDVAPQHFAKRRNKEQDPLELFSGKQVTGEEGESFPSFAAENVFNQSNAGNQTLCQPLELAQRGIAIKTF